MAHHHSPSPSGSSRRRLSEMLGEQQEPFYLDLYVLEKGCSPAFLDAAACGGACSTCWPTTRSQSTGGRLPRRTPGRSKMGRRGVLRLLLSKILSGAGATTTAPAKKKRQQQPAAAIAWRRADASAEDDADEKQSTLGCYANAAVPDSPSAAAVECRHRTEVDEEREEDDGEDDDESSKKQLSPVSVLEQCLFEHSPPPPPPHAQKAFVLFSDLLEAAYTPTPLVHLLANARARQHSVISTPKDGHRRRRSSDSGGSTPATTRRRRSRNSTNNNKHARARRDADDDDDDKQFERELAMATALVASEMPVGGWVVWAEDAVRTEREDVAASVAAVVLDALTEEAAAELMMVVGPGPGVLCG
ncbi:unnamed protein product [Urochloa humidicola]